MQEQQHNAGPPAAGSSSTTAAAHINALPPGVLHLVFSFLGPRDLAACTTVSRSWHALNRDRAANRLWQGFYSSRWLITGAAGDDVCWQTKYGSKMKQGKSWSGKYEHDGLYGHKAGVKACRLLPSYGMLLTGSQDRTVRLWDLNYGMPLSISRPHGGTVRAVALDHRLAASGSSDNVVRLWHARHSTGGSSSLDPAEAAAAAAELDLPGLDAAGLVAAGRFLQLDAPGDAAGNGQQLATAAAAAGLSATAVAAVAAASAVAGGRGPYSIVTGEADEGLFDLALPGQHLRGHIGPVTSLCLSEACLFSGSWDYSVRVWRRGSWDCISVLKFPDWVWSVVARAGMLLVASGPEVHVHDLPTGKLVRKFQNLHEGSVSCLEGCHSGATLFTGGADGLLMAHDLRMREPSRVLWHHNAGINGLALEHPWLASAASDGTVIMHNLEAALPTNSSTSTSRGTSRAGGSGSRGGSSSSAPARRSLSSPGHSGPMFCVDIAESWLAAGGEAAAVSTWDFTKAAEAAARAAAAKAARNSSKRAAKQRKAAAVAAAAAGTAAGGPGAGAAAVVGGNGVRRGWERVEGCGRAGRGESNAAVGGSSSSNAALESGGSSSAAAAAAGARGSSGAAGERTAGSSAAAAAAAGGVSQGLARQQWQQQQGGEQMSRDAASSSGASRHSQPGNRGGGTAALFSRSPQQAGFHYGSPQQRQQQHYVYGYGSSPQQQQWHYSSSPPSGAGSRRSRAGSSGGTRQGIPIPVGSGARAAAAAGGCGSVGSGGSSGGRQAAQLYHRRPAAAGGGLREGSAAAAASGGGGGVPGAAGGGGGSGHTNSSSGSGDGGQRAAGGAAYNVAFSSSYPSAAQPGPWLVAGSSPRFEPGVDRCRTTAPAAAGGGGAVAAAPGRRGGSASSSSRFAVVVGAAAGQGAAAEAAPSGAAGPEFPERGSISN